MIAKMTKVTFLVYHKEYDCFLKSIRDLGSRTCGDKGAGRSRKRFLAGKYPLVGPVCFCHQIVAGNGSAFC